MSEVNPDGTTVKDNLINAARQKKKKLTDLYEFVELPDCMKEYWNWFIKLSNKRPSGMGLSAIPYSEMKAFFSLYDITPDPCEIEIVEMFDTVAMKHYQKQQQKEKNKAKAKSTK